MQRPYEAYPAAASAWTWRAPTSIRSAAPSTSVRGRRRLLRHHQDPADARASVSALIVERGSVLPFRSFRWLNWRVRAPTRKHAFERIKDTAALRLRNKRSPWMHLKKLLKIDDACSSDSLNGFIVVTQVGSQTFGIVVDGVFPHRGPRGQADVDQALSHRQPGYTILRCGHHESTRLQLGIAKASCASGNAWSEIADETRASGPVPVLSS